MAVAAAPPPPPCRPGACRHCRTAAVAAAAVAVVGQGGRRSLLLAGQHGDLTLALAPRALPHGRRRLSVTKGMHEGGSV
jgi:hypothetical protein